MEFVIKNLMETVVESKVKELIEEVDCCKCEKCRMDITAYVLNRLPAKYVSTEKGALFAELDMLNNQHEADIMTNILKGIDLIAKNPHHWTPDEAKENGLKKHEMKFNLDVNDDGIKPVQNPQPLYNPANPIYNTAQPMQNAVYPPAGAAPDMYANNPQRTAAAPDQMKTANTQSPLSRLSGAVRKNAEMAKASVNNANEMSYAQSINDNFEEEEETYSSSDFDVFVSKD